MSYPKARLNTTFSDTEGDSRIVVIIIIITIYIIIIITTIRMDVTFFPFLMAETAVASAIIIGGDVWSIIST